MNLIPNRNSLINQVLSIIYTYLINSSVKIINKKQSLYSIFKLFFLVFISDFTSDSITTWLVNFSEKY